MTAHRTIDLCSAWRLDCLDAARGWSDLSAHVPGCVQEDLIAAGLLHDVHGERGDDGYAFVTRTAWRYRRHLEVPLEGHLELVFDAVDTLAEVRLDRRLLGRCDNALRPWRFVLEPGTRGELAVTFEPLFDELERRNAERRLPGWGVGQDKDDTGAWVRKAPVDFGWDFAPKVVPVGLRGPVRLECSGAARLADLHVRQRHEKGGVTLEVHVRVQCFEPVDARLAVDLTAPDGTARTIDSELEGDLARVIVHVDDPALWWPNGMGAQPLYSLWVRLLDRAGTDLDEARRTIGLRRLELLRESDADGESFGFAANGRAFFALGANWVPADALPSRAPERVEPLLRQAAEAGMNTIRVWGGGGSESDAFYELCDRLGLVVWQDFAFACSTYPTFDATWMDSVRAEATHQIRRLRHHACLALWCGNNEVENGLAGPEWTGERMAWSDYARLFDRMLPELVAEHDPDSAYWPGSPHSPLGDRMDFNSPRSGDAHLWAQWHGGEPFEAYRAHVHRFVSEVGWQSVPSDPPPFVPTRQRSAVGDARLREVLARHGLTFTDDASFVQATQELQARFAELVVTHAVANWPRCRGVLWWQLNEPWLAPTWSLIDHAGRPKPALRAFGVRLPHDPTDHG